MNLALTLVLFAVFFTFPPEIVGTKVIVASVEPGSPAQSAGMLPGDVFLQKGISPDSSPLLLLEQPTDSDPYGGQPIDSLRDVTDYTESNLGREVTFLLARGNTPVIVQLIPRANPPPEQGPMGIGVGVSGGEVVTRFSPSFSVIPESFRQLYRFVVTLGESIGNIFTSSEGREGLAGPIGIAQVTGEVAKTGVLPFVGFVAILSLNLAIFNLLPIPALDGGRLLFVIIEGCARRPSSPAQKRGHNPSHGIHVPNHHHRPHQLQRHRSSDPRRTIPPLIPHPFACHSVAPRGI